MFTYFPDTYPWNLALGLSLGMGAELAEVDAACWPLLALGAAGPAAQGEAWLHNWVRVAQHVRGAACCLTSQGECLLAIIDAVDAGEKPTETSFGKTAPPFNSSLAVVEHRF